MTPQQKFNQALLKLCILIYKIDGKITLREQDYFQALADKIDWRGDEEIEDFLVRSIYEVRAIIEAQTIKPFINSLKDDLLLDAKKALTVAQGISLIDGELADAEEDILEYLENRVLAKALESNGQLESNTHESPTQKIVKDSVED